MKIEIILLGIIGLVFVFLPILNLASIILNIIAIVLGSGAISHYKRNKDKYTEASYKNAKAGLICGIIGLGLMVIGIIIILAGFSVGAFN